MLDPRFLVISLGNPLAIYPTLHSAGHFALNGLAGLLRHPPFRELSLGRESCLVSPGPKYTLVQSPTLMNLSGPFVARAWADALKRHDAAALGLVLVHDELELDFGLVKLQPWDRSHRGHNGVKSVKASLSPAKFPRSPFARIAIGIGRPVGRDPATVSEYVLKKITTEQKGVLQEKVPWHLAGKLADMESEWQAGFQE